MRTKGFKKYEFERSIALKEIKIKQLEHSIQVLQLFREVNLVKLVGIKKEIEVLQLEIAEMFLLMDEVDENDEAQSR